jgi:hypothetical protein
MKIVGVVVGILVLALVARVAWYRWPPVARYMVRRTYVSMQNTVREYLDGRLDRDAAARQLAERIKWVQAQGWPNPEPNDTKPGTASLTAVALLITPAGYSPTDPRIAPLEEKMMEYFWGSERYQEIQERVRQMRERLSSEPPQ